MEDTATQTFDNIIGKKIPKEQVEIQSKGYFEAFREGIPGGFRITFAKFKIGVINGKQRQVLWLDAMPPKELLMEGISVSDVAFDGGDGKEVHGSYGICDGRKFFVPGAANPKARTRKA